MQRTTAVVDLDSEHATIDSLTTGSDIDVDTLIALSSASSVVGIWSAADLSSGSRSYVSHFPVRVLYIIQRTYVHPCALALLSTSMRAIAYERQSGWPCGPQRPLHRECLSAEWNAQGAG